MEKKNKMILTSHNKKRILTYVRRMIGDGTSRSFYPKLMNDRQQILCFQDFRTIEVGSHYKSIKGHGKVAKFFHLDCYNRMWY